MQSRMEYPVHQPVPNYSTGMKKRGFSKMWIMWIKKVSTKTPFGEKRMKVWKYKDLQLFGIKMWITLCKQKNPHSKVEVFPN